MIDIAEIKNPYVMAAIAILKRQEPPSAVEIKEVVSKICNYFHTVIFFATAIYVR